MADDNTNGTLLGGEPPATSATAPQTLNPAPSADPAPANLSYLAGPDGALPDGWRTHLPAEIRDSKSLDSIKTIQGLASSFVSAQKMVGADKLAVPGKDATPEEWGKVFDALGRPKEATGYSALSGEAAAGFTPDQAKAIGETFWKNGFTDAQVTAIMDLYRQQTQANEQSAESARATTEAELRKEWGLMYSQNRRLADGMLTALGLREVMAGNQLLNNADFIKALAAYGAKLGEAKLADAAGEPARASVKERLDAILGDKSHAYYNASDPRHAAAVSEVMRLLATQGGQS